MVPALRADDVAKRRHQSVRRSGARRVPELVEAFVREGRRVYGVRVLATTLEEEYLDAVGGDTA